jgi:5-methylthioadenosine/S-adenosylhomocysteine deaminase
MIIRCRCIVTQDDDRRILEHASIRVEGNEIIAVGDLTPKSKEKILDWSDRVVLPGLINCHSHLPMSGLRGVSDDKELDEWLADIVVAEHKLTPAQRKDAALLAMREALRTGTTSIVDHYWDHCSLDANPGLRLFFFEDYFKAHRTLDRIDLPKAKGLATVGLAPHSIYGTDAPFLRSARAYASKHAVRLHTHVAETRKERVDCLQAHGKLPVHLLHDIGFLGPDVMLVHMVWVTKGELDLIAKAGSHVVHCPQSNMKLAGGGVMPLLEMRERGINVALGTDSVASNNSLDLFREMHVAALLHKHHYWDGRVADAQTVLDMATRNGAKALGRNDLGVIAPGMRADLIALDASASQLAPLLPERIVSHLVYSADGSLVRDVMVDGKLVLKDARFE